MTDKKEKVLRPKLNIPLQPIDNFFPKEFYRELCEANLDFALTAASLYTLLKETDRRELFFTKNNNLWINDKVIERYVNRTNEELEALLEEIRSLNEQDTSKRLSREIMEEIGFSINSNVLWKRTSKENLRQFVYWFLILETLNVQNPRNSQGKFSQEGVNLHFSRDVTKPEDENSQFFQWIQKMVFDDTYCLRPILGFLIEKCYDDIFLDFKNFVRETKTQTWYLNNYLPHLFLYVQKWVMRVVLSTKSVEEILDLEKFRSMMLTDPTKSFYPTNELINTYNLKKIIFLFMPALLLGKLLSEGIRNFIK